MFFSSVPKVEFVELTGNQLVLLSDRLLELGQEIAVQARLQAAGEKPKRVLLKVFLHQARRVRGGQLGYFGTLQTELPFQPLSNSAAWEMAALRRGTRRGCSLRVLSPDLPFYTALSVDVSLTGLQVETTRALILGSVIPLHLEAPPEGGDDIHLNARVAWCHRKNPKVFRCGLEFRDVTPDARARLGQLDTYLRLRETSDVREFQIDRSVTTAALVSE